MKCIHTKRNTNDVQAMYVKDALDKYNKHSNNVCNTKLNKYNKFRGTNNNTKITQM